MKSIQTAIVVFGVILGVATSVAADKPPVEKKAKDKPYKLKTCIVSDEKLGGDMGKPFVFSYEGQEIKLCCKGCKEDFDKEPAKFLKKLTEPPKKPAAPDKKKAAKV